MQFNTFVMLLHIFVVFKNVNNMGILKNQLLTSPKKLHIFSFQIPLKKKSSFTNNCTSSPHKLSRS